MELALASSVTFSKVLQENLLDIGLIDTINGHYKIATLKIQLPKSYDFK